MMGDGGINNPWQVTISVNAVRDKNYAKYVSELCFTLFNIRPAIQIRKPRNTLVLRLSSTTIVDFLVTLGLPRGNKLKHGLKIPPWILKKRAYKKACVRGLMDTDGCLFIHIHNVKGKTYRNLGLSFRNHSRELIFQVAEIFEEFGIIPHITERERDVCLYRADDVTKYLAIFGSSNKRITSVYKKWRGG